MKLFKYMSLDMVALSDLHLRISSRGCLNDPFEFLPTLSAEGKKVEVMQSLDNYSIELLGALQNLDYKNELDYDLSQYGVVCLSENGSSNLMWSHYADDHKGVMLELEPERLFQFSPDQLKVMDNDFSAASTKPIPIDYIDQRLRSDISAEYLYEYANSNFIKRIFTAKSIEWSYEKEWRYIFKFFHADKVIVNVAEIQNKNIATELARCKIPFELEGNLLIVNAGDNDFNIIVVDSLSKNYGLTPIYLKSVNPQCIKAIHFGFRVTESIAKATKEVLIKKDEAYKNVTFKKVNLDEDSYQLRSTAL